MSRSKSLSVRHLTVLGAAAVLYATGLALRTAARPMAVGRLPL